MIFVWEQMVEYVKEDKKYYQSIMDLWETVGIWFGLEDQNIMEQEEAALESKEESMYVQEGRPEVVHLSFELDLHSMCLLHVISDRSMKFYLVCEENYFIFIFNLLEDCFYIKEL